jgi:flagellar hook-associated protein 1 FlgK
MFPTNILGSLNLARRSMVAQQTALNTIGHNLANAATAGYTRQRTELVPATPGGGVDVQEVRRIRDRFLDLSLLIEQQALGKNQAQENTLQRLQAIFNDPPDFGLSSMMDQLFQGFQDLSVRPTDNAVRATVKDRAERLASTFQSMRARIDQLKTDLTTEIQQRVTTANALTTQIGDLHRQIIAAQGGPAPNDLLDQRDKLVADLTQIVGVTATDRPNGTVQLAMTGTGVLLVDGTAVTPLTATLNAGADTMDLTAGTTLAVTPKSGALAAVLDARNSSTGAVKQAASDLDTLAKAIVAEMNRLHASGSGLSEHTSLTAVNAVSSSAAALTAAGLAFTPVSGTFKVYVHNATGAVASSVTVTVTAGVTTLEDVRAALDADPNLAATITGGKLTVTTAAGTTFAFAADTSDALMALGLNTFFTGTDARTIAVNPVVSSDAAKIAAAKADAGGLVHQGDGANALALAQLRTKLAMNGSTSTFGDFYGAAVGRVGSLARDATQALERQQASVQLVRGLQQQTSGVSTDEELISLTQSQTAYAAAAKFATTINDIIETLLQMGR